MKRRSFIKNSALCAVAISATGFIRFNGEYYEGDCETTTDILGPFYRPEAPVRSNLLVKNAPGQEVVLSGTIKHKDCIRPLKNACVELWHCSAEGVYDNDSPDFLYRGKTYADEKGNYHFRTVIPVPYGVGNGQTRPAHYHMLISAPGYQSLVTQLYFTGDPYIKEDPSSASPLAKKRILEIKNGKNGEKTVSFDITMMEKIPASAEVINRLIGTYTDIKDKNQKTEFFNRNNQLWYKSKSSINGGYPLHYTGNNVFESYGEKNSAHFEIKADGSVQMTLSLINDKGEKNVLIAIKEK